MSTHASFLSMSRRTVAAVVCGAVAALAPGTAAATPRPTVTLTDLGTLGGALSFARALNERGLVVGWSRTADELDDHAFLWDRGRMRDLGTLGGRYSDAVAINDRGQVTGSSSTAENGSESARRPYVWERGLMRDLGTPPDTEWGSGLSINNRGQVAGLYRRLGGEDHAFLWEDGVIREILGPGGATGPQVVDLNDRGQVLGLYNTPAGIRGFVWRDGVAVDLGSLATYGSLFPADINERGQVAASGPTATSNAFVLHALRWERGRWTDLGTAGGQSLANAINDRGTVVGAGVAYVDPSDPFDHSNDQAAISRRGQPLQFLPHVPGGTTHSNAFGVNKHNQVIGDQGTGFAMLWQHGRGTLLPAPAGSPYSVTLAADINDRGQIAGYAVSATGEDHAVLWTVRNR
jgi:probable HAF family extracellular repeat protein